MQRLVVARLLAHVLIAVFKLWVMAPRWTPEQRSNEICRWSRKVFELLGIRLVVRNAPQPEKSATLFAGNHVSWLDIYALLACADLRFVAKSEVRDWPIVGWLATRLGTRFIVRDKRGEAYITACAMLELLRAGRNMCIFPEGSTTDGTMLRPFRAALFDPAAQGRACVQPFAIRYTDADGRLSEAAAFVDDMSITQSLALLMRHRGINCEITFLPAIDTSAMDRRAVALAVERAVATHLSVGVALGQPVAARMPDLVAVRDLAAS